MKKLILGLILLTLVSSLYFGNNGWASTKETNQSLLPKAEDIKEKKHFKILSQIKQKDELDRYLNSLNEKEILLTVAEAAEELYKQGAYSEISVFAQYVDKKLINKMKENDYISILENPAYSNPFKVFMIDTYSYSRKKNNQKFEKAFNQTLKDIIKDANEDSGLRFYAISTVDNFDQTDVMMLKEIIETEKEGYLKAAALKALEKISKDEAYNLSKNILKNYQVHPAEKVIMAMYTAVKSANEDNVTEDIENILKTAKDPSIIRGAVFALGDIKSEKSVRIILDHRQIINDDSLIIYYVDKNYLVIERMLDNFNDVETIKTALDSIEIAPFKNFKQKLEELINMNQNEDIKKQAKLLIEKINENSFEHNIKWDLDK